MTQPARPDTPPDAISFPHAPDYEILGELGRGGMGVVVAKGGPGTVLPGGFAVG